MRRPLRWSSLASRILCWMIVLAPALSLAMEGEERLLFANGLYRRGLYDLAIPEFRALMEDEAASAKHDLAAFRLGECYRALGQANEAATAYDAVLAANPDGEFADRAAFRRAELDWSAGRLRDAARRFKALLEGKPEDEIAAAALYHLALCDAGMDRDREAAAGLRRMLKNHPASPYAGYARLALASALEKSGGDDREIENLLREVADHSDTPALAAEALARAALLSYRTGDAVTAATRFELLAADHPGSPWIDRTRLEAAWSFLLANRPDHARDRADAGLAAASGIADRIPWLYLSANIERRAGDAARALARYDEVLSSAPDHELAGPARFEACSLAHRESDAARVLRLTALDAAATPEQQLQMMWMRASALEDSGRNDEARAILQSIVEDHPGSDLAPAAAYRLAVFTEQAGDHAAAATAFAAVAETYPGADVAADALMASAAAFLKAGSPRKAVSTWQDLVKNHPGYAALDEAYLGLARAQVEAGWDRAAAESLQTLIDRFPESRALADAHYLRGTLYEKEDLYPEAEFHYLRSLSRKPSRALQQQIQYRRVAVLQRQGRNDDAAGLMNDLLAAGEGDQLPSPLLEWLSRWNLEQKDYAAARRSAALLARLGDTEAWRQAGCYIEGVAARALGGKDDALEAFGRAAAFGLNNRETADALFQSGQIRQEQRQPVEAIRLFTAAAERAASGDTMDIRARSYLQLGIAHEALERWDEAGRYYLGVGVLFDDPALTPESLYRAAGALGAQLKEKERDRVVEELRQRFPDSEWAKRANERWPEESRDRP